MHSKTVPVAAVTLGLLGFVSSQSSVSLNFPSKPPTGAQVINGTFQGFSIEWAYMADYGGNLSHPNKLSYNLLDNLVTLSGSASYIRTGGSSGNLPTYNATQTVGVIESFASATADQPNKVSIGPAWYESFKTFPAGTKYVYQVNYRDNTTKGVSNTIAEAKRVYAALGNTLESYELGNEMGGWANRGRPANWDAAMYVQDWLNYTNKIGPDVFGANEFAGQEPRFQAGTFVGLGGTGFDLNTDHWNAEYILQQGIDKTKRVKSISLHDYMGANCVDSTAIATLAGNVMNHDRVTYIVYPHAQQAAFTATYGVEYVLGETNSISCQGKEGVSNVFGAALWIVDYQLYAAQTQIRRMYFHSGTPYRYSSWQPIPFRGLPASARPAYYGNLFMAQLLQGGDKQVTILTNTTHLTTYGIYTSGKLSDVAIINLNMYNSTQTTVRPTINVKLSANVTAGRKGVVRRLTAPGAEVKTNITFAGRTVAADGTMSGEVTEPLNADGSVLVKSTEAVLVSF